MSLNMDFNTEAYSRIEIFAYMSCDTRIEITGGKQTIVMEADGRRYRRLTCSLKAYSRYTMCTENAEIRLCYLCGNEEILDTGVRFLETGGSWQKQTLWPRLNTAAREAYHFTPFSGWMNDPNGWCHYQGRWHLFYQYNPYRQEPGEMHWGHAVSRDLIHWVYLPVVLEPETTMQYHTEIRGGAYSGGALIQKDQVSLFFTRRLGFAKARLPFCESQSMVSTKDMISFSPERALMLDRPSDITDDFRDPQVTRIDEGYQMLLGSACIDGSTAVLRYTSSDLKHWQYRGKLIEDIIGEAMECPDFFKLDDQWVLTVSIMKYRDSEGRVFGMMWYAGKWDGERFQPCQKGLLDFGTNLYAMQSFEYEGRRIAIGWVSDFYKERLIDECGASGCMCLPRELFMREGRLCMLPVCEIASMKQELVYHNTGRVQLPENRYYALVELNRSTNFVLTLAHRPSDHAIMQLVCKNDGIELQLRGTNSDKVRFVANENKITTIEIYADRQVTEIFLNNGDYCATKRFYSETGLFESCFDDLTAIRTIQVWTMGNCWSC